MTSNCWRIDNVWVAHPFALLAKGWGRTTASFPLENCHPEQREGPAFLQRGTTSRVPHPYALLADGWDTSTARPATSPGAPRLASETWDSTNASAEPRRPRRILVLGATSGIAEACCRLWASRGESLYLIARNPDRLAAVAADMRTRGASFVDFAVADLDATATHPELLAHAINSLAGLDTAFLAIGSLGDQAKAERTFDEAARLLHTNYTAPVSLLTWLANYCSQRHAGTLAVLSSVAGERGRKSNYVYGSAKAGLTAFLSGLRNRIDRDGVNVLTIKPGPTKTAMTQGMKGHEKMADVETSATAIVNAIDARRDVLYVPTKWAVIMAVIRFIPERFFKNTNL